MAVTVIFGGTFNPFHIGHYEMLTALNARPEIDKIYIVPDKIPPHKVCDYLAPDNDRIEMCRLAAEDFDKAEVCLIEFEREGKSYTFDTVMELKKLYPYDKFYLACGGDMISSLESWYKFDLLIKATGFYAFRRKGVKDFDIYTERLRKMGAEITVIDTTVSEVSSTQIRNKLKCGKISELLPFKIQQYIIKKDLYNECDNT